MFLTYFGIMLHTEETKINYESPCQKNNCF